MGRSVVVLPEPAAPSIAATRPPRAVAMADRQRLLLAQRIALLQKGLEPSPRPPGTEARDRLSAAMA